MLGYSNFVNSKQERKNINLAAVLNSCPYKSFNVNS